MYLLRIYAQTLEVISMNFGADNDGFLDTAKIYNNVKKLVTTNNTRLEQQLVTSNFIFSIF